MSLTAAFEVSPAATFRAFTPPACAYEAIVACASANFAFISSYERGAAFETAVATVARGDDMAGLDAEALASPRCLLFAGSSSSLEAGPETIDRRVSGVNVSSGDGDRLL